MYWSVKKRKEKVNNRVRPIMESLALAVHMLLVSMIFNGLAAPDATFLYNELFHLLITRVLVHINHF